MSVREEASATGGQAKVELAWAQPVLEQVVELVLGDEVSELVEPVWAQQVSAGAAGSSRRCDQLPAACL